MGGTVPAVEADVVHDHGHTFETSIVHHDVGSYRYTVVFLAADLAGALPLERHPRLRVAGDIGGVPFTGAWQPVRGRWYLMLSKALVRRGGYAVGDRVVVRFRVVAQDEVEVPPALQRVFDRDDEVRSAWEALSVGKRRGLVHRLLSAKTAETQARRLDEVVEALQAGV